MTRVIVSGGRHFQDGEMVFAVLDRLHAKRGITVIIEGGQRRRDTRTGKFDGGADYWGFAWAKARGIPVITEEADWTDLTHPDADIRQGPRGPYDAAAGPRRNQRMLDLHKPDLVVSLPGKRGTSDMRTKARAAGVELMVIKP